MGAVLHFVISGHLDLMHGSYTLFSDWIVLPATSGINLVFKKILDHIVLFKELRKKNTVYKNHSPKILNIFFFLNFIISLKY